MTNRPQPPRASQASGRVLVGRRACVGGRVTNVIREGTRDDLLGIIFAEYGSIVQLGPT